MDNIKRKKIIALILGLALLIFYIYNRIHPIFVSSIEQIMAGQIINFFVYVVIRIIAAILCVSIANSLHRSQIFWGIFGFILPPIALIAVYFVEIKVKIEINQSFSSTDIPKQKTDENNIP